MEKHPATWLKNIITHADNCRLSRPVPGRSTLSYSQMLQANIIKGSLLNQTAKNASSLIQGSASLDTRQKCIIFTSTRPGMIAAGEISRKMIFPFILLYPEELRRFLRFFPDNTYRYHIHTWSYFIEEPDGINIGFAEQYPLNDREKYWLHVEGIMKGPKFGRGAEHLWSWDGNRAKLLKKNLHQWAA